MPKFDLKQIDTGSIVTSGSLNQYSASVAITIDSVYASQSLYTPSSSFNDFYSSYSIDSASFDSRITNVNVDTSYLATTGSNTFTGTQYVSGSVVTVNTDYEAGLNPSVVYTVDNINNSYAAIFAEGSLLLKSTNSGSADVYIRANNVSQSIQLEAPNKDSGTYTLATTSDLSLSSSLSYGNETQGQDIVLTPNDRITVGTNRAGFGRGSFDTERSGDNGVSLFCAVTPSYEFNWQAGYLRILQEGNGGTPLPLYTDSELIYSSTVSTIPSSGSSLVTKDYVDAASPIRLVNSSSLFSTVLSDYSETSTTDSILLGKEAGQGVSGQKQVSIGYYAGYLAYSAYNSVFIGVSAGDSAPNANKSIFIGHRAGNNAQYAYHSTFLGRYSGTNATNADTSVFIGHYAGYGAVNARHSIFIGDRAGQNDGVDNTTYGYSSIAIGDNSSPGGYPNSIALGKDAVNTATNQFLLSSGITHLVFPLNGQATGSVLMSDGVKADWQPLPSYIPYTGGSGSINFQGNLVINGPISAQDTSAYGAIADSLTIRGGEGTAGSNGGGNLILKGGNSFTGDAEAAGDVQIKGGINTYSTTYGGYVRISTLDTERVTVTNDGKVGFNNINPTEAVDVSGSVKATSFIKTDGTSSEFLKADGSVDSGSYLLVSDTASYVPYTGAVQDVDLGTKSIFLEKTRYNLNPTVTPQEGDVWWNPTDHTLNIQPDIAGSVLQVGQEQWVRVVNKTGATIADGSVVYLNGAQGNRPKVALASASDINSAAVIGMATADINNNAEGFITVNGIVRGINTTGYTDGQELYLSITAGQLATTPPSSPNIVVRVGYALNSTHNGSVFVDTANHLASNVNLGTDNSVAPTQNAVKTYVDTSVSIYTTTSSFNSYTSSAATQINNVFASQSAYLPTSSFNTFSSSYNTASGSFDSRINAKYTLPTLTSGSVLVASGSTITTSSVSIVNNSLGLGTLAPTHTITLASGSTGITLYNTADQTTNYDRFRAFYSGSIITIGSFAGGTGTTRSLRLGVERILGDGAVGRYLEINQTPSLSGGNFVFVNGGTATQGNLASIQGSFNGAAVQQNTLALVSQIGQTNAAGTNRSLWISPFYTGNSSTNNFLIDAGTNSAANGSGTHTSVFTVTSTGATTISGQLTTATGTNSLAPLRIPAGTNLTSATSGVIENDGTRLYYTDNTPTRRTLAFTTDAAGAGGSNGQVQFNNSGSLSGSSNLFWDNSNNRLGINTSSPTNILDIRASSSQYINIQASNATNTEVGYIARNNAGNLFAMTSTSTSFGPSYLANTATFVTNGQSVAFITNGNLGNGGTGTISFWTGGSNTTQQRMQIFANGNILMQGGGTFTDNGARLQVAGNLSLTTAGNKINIATGTNASVGTATLSSGTVTVNTTAVTASSVILLTVQETGTNNGRIRVSARVAGTSFTISSSDSGDNCVIAYQIIN